MIAMISSCNINKIHAYMYRDDIDT